MKRILALMLCCLLLCGCHGTLVQPGAASDEHVHFPEIPTELDSSKQIEISFWAKNDTNKVQTDIYRNAIASFQSLYPNITVNMRQYTDYNRIYNDVITNIATNTTPNVCITYPDHIATYLTGADTVVPLDTLFQDGAYGLGGSQLRFDSPTPEEIIPQFLNECRLNGHYYAIPYMRSTEACYVNRDFVEKLGYTLPETLTWDFIWEVSEAATAKNPDGTYVLNGQKVLIPFIYKSTDNMMIQQLRQLDAPYASVNGEIGIFSDNTRALLDQVAEHTKSGAFSTFKISSYPANFLNAGQCIFAIDSTAGATWMGSNAPLLDIAPEQLVQFDTAVLPVPQFDPQNPKMISQGPSLCLFQKDDPQEVLASWLFAQYLLTNEVQIAYACTEGYVPVTGKAQQDAAYQDYLSRSGEDNDTHYDVKIRASKLLLENTGSTFTTPVFNGSASLRNAAGDMIESVTKAIRRKQTVDDAFVDKLYKEMVSLYRLDQIVVTDAVPDESDPGPLPLEAKALLGGLALCWVGIGLYLAADLGKRKHKGGNA